LAVGQYPENWDLASSPLPVGTPLDHILFIYFISAHQHQYRAVDAAIIDADTDSNSALGVRLS
jgi:hypothetical protein